MIVGEGMQLNTNYDDLYRQIKNMEEHFLDCTNLNSSAVYYGAYQNLVEFYFWSTYQTPSNKKINRNRYVRFSGRQHLNSLGNKRIENFISSQKSHLSFISSTFFDYADIVDDFVSSKFYESIYWKSDPVISDYEEQDILYSFFDECCPGMRDLFDSYRERGKFYKLPQAPFFSNRDGCTFYNPIENDSDIFCHPKIRSLKFSSLMVHELSHALDFSRYSLKASPVNVCLYQMRSPFCEVPAFYHQFRFYDYLLKNGIYKDAVIIELTSELVKAIGEMDNLLLLSLLPPENLRKQSEFLSKNETLLTILENSKEDCPIEFDDSKVEEDEMVSLDEAIQYSYGPILGLALMGDEELYRKFSMIRGSYFDIDKLSSIGLSPQEVQQKVMKKCDDFLGEYL